MFTNQGDSFLPYITGETNEPMPLYVKPNHKITVQEIKNAMRDHYEGTPFDISNDFGAGIYKTPYRLSPLEFEVNGEKYFNERPISTFQTGFVFVSQMRSNKPNAIGGVLWFGLDDANMTVFTPIYCCTDKIPICYASNGADYITFSWDSSFWIFNWVANMVYPHYNLMIGDVHTVRQRLENTFNEAQEGIEAVATKIYTQNSEEAETFLTNYTNMAAQNAYDNWKRLGEHLIVKYNDGVIKQEKNGKFERNSIGQPMPVIRPGYPKDFLEEYVKQTGDRYKIKIK
jgi:dipeptidase